MRRFLLPILCIAFATVFFSSCASTNTIKKKSTDTTTIKKKTTDKNTNGKKTKNNVQTDSDKKYKTEGIAAQVGATQQGESSYYADKYHGRTTASGAKYDKNKMTCAHRTLPFGTKICVTRKDNGKSVDVTVNDRGPFIQGRIVDLSRAAANKINLVKDGVTKVNVKVLSLSKK